MPGRRDQVLTAAVRVLAESGARALTHRAVDTAAGVPQGTTSNHFRNREALVGGVVAHVADAELAIWTEAGAGKADVAAGLAAAMIALTGEHRELSLARYAIFQDALGHAELRAALDAQTARFFAAGTDVMAALGAADPARSGRVLLACVNGIVHDQLLRPVPDFDPEPDLRRIISGLLSG